MANPRVEKMKNYEPSATFDVFNREFSASYASFKADYPLLFSLMELDLRLVASGRVLQAKRNLGGLLQSYYAQPKYSLRKARSLCLCHQDVSRVINLKRFPVVEGHLCSLWGVRATETSQARIRSAYWLCIKEALNSLNIKKTLAMLHDSNFQLRSSPLHDRTEEDLNLNAAKIRKIFEKKSLFCTDDTYSYAASVICIALKETRTAIVEIAHGLPQDPFMVSIAPIRADAFITWSENSKQVVQAISPVGTKVASFGCPTILKSPRNVKSLLILVPHISLSSECLLRDCLDMVVKTSITMKRYNWTTECRLHPKDRGTFVERKLRDENIKVVEGSIETAFDNIGAVAGYASSVLFQAASNKIPAFQFVDNESLGSSMVIEGAIGVVSGDLCKAIEGIDKIRGQLSGNVINLKSLTDYISVIEQNKLGGRFD